MLMLGAEGAYAGRRREESDQWHNKHSLVQEQGSHCCGTKAQEVCHYDSSKAAKCGVRFKHARSKGRTKLDITL